MRRDLIIAALLIVILSCSLSMITTTRSQPKAGEYDPWIDINDDGIIDMKDIGTLARAFGARGTPINKTELVLYLNLTVHELQDNVTLLQARLADLEAEVTSLQGSVSTLFTDVGDMKVDIDVLKSDLAILNASIGELQNRVTVNEVDIAALFTSLAALQSDVDTISSRVAVLESDVDDLKAWRLYVDSYLANLTQKIDNLEALVTAMNTTIEESMPYNETLGTFSINTVYQNTRARKILVVAYGNSDGDGYYLRGYIGSSSPDTMVAQDRWRGASITFVVPPGYYWKITQTENGNPRIEAWEM